MSVLFPETVGAWHRTALEDQKPAATETGVEQIRAASYEGPGKLEASAYRMTAPALALDRAQRWQPAPDTIFFYGDRYFVTVHWQSADRAALHQFVSTLQNALKPSPTRD
jgi:hypothetical protein